MKTRFIYFLVIGVILLFIPVAALADPVPWTTQQYTAHTCAGYDLDVCFQEDIVSGPTAPVDAYSFYTWNGIPGPGMTNSHSNITDTIMSINTYVNHADEEAEARAEFSGQYYAVVPEFWFTYSMDSPYSQAIAWLTVTDQTSGDILADYTLNTTADPTLLSVNTTPSHLISVDFGIATHCSTPCNLSSHTLMYTAAVAPEPISSILFLTGGTLLAGRRYIRRKRII